MLRPLNSNIQHLPQGISGVIMPSGMIYHADGLADWPLEVSGDPASNQPMSREEFSREYTHAPINQPMPEGSAMLDGGLIAMPGGEFTLPDGECILPIQNPVCPPMSREEFAAIYSHAPVPENYAQRRRMTYETMTHEAFALLYSSPDEAERKLIAKMYGIAR